MSDEECRKAGAEYYVGTLKPDLEKLLIHRRLRFCPECIADEFHTPLFQVSFVERCPVHLLPLRTKNALSAALPNALTAGRIAEISIDPHATRYLDEAVDWMRRTILNPPLISRTTHPQKQLSRFPLVWAEAACLNDIPKWIRTEETFSARLQMSTRWPCRFKGRPGMECDSIGTNPLISVYKSITRHLWRRFLTRAERKTVVRLSRRDEINDRNGPYRLWAHPEMAPKIAALFSWKMFWENAYEPALLFNIAGNPRFRDCFRGFDELILHASHGLWSDEGEEWQSLPLKMKMRVFGRSCLFGWRHVRARSKLRTDWTFAHYPQSRPQFPPAKTLRGWLDKPTCGVESLKSSLLAS
ncbi:hypothetical protein [Verrucomicrobium sp. GAS474]|uniref:hypothetical protein n=1 Tax=Verrucomicrobium sp. GAS474 TaxID=1882831 RepID=UPI00138FB99F|nr:hypothetical protein [Verrucomicrobium sp. GAS474]